MSFKNVHWLLAIPFVVVGLTLAFYWLHNNVHRTLGRFAAHTLLGQLLWSYSVGRKAFKGGCLIMGVVCLLVALARPQWGYRWEKVKSKGLDVMFALDASKSMLAQDMRPNRLERAKLAVIDLIRDSQGDRVGLIAFAKDAFLQCPLTLDYDAFLLSLKAVEVGIIQHGGTNIAAAIRVAEEAYSESNEKILILITDGEDLEKQGTERAQEAASRGMTIYTVGVGGKKGELIPLVNNNFQKDSKGNLVRTRLDEKGLTSMAEAANGLYVRLDAGNEGLKKIDDALRRKFPRKTLSSHMERVGIKRFQFPLALGLLLLALEPLISVRRRRS
jgi:Ca-activated chloride channel homolog